MYKVSETFKQMVETVGIYRPSTDMLHMVKDEKSPDLVGVWTPYKLVCDRYREMFVFDEEGEDVLAHLTTDSLRALAAEGAGVTTLSLRIVDRAGHHHCLEVSTEPVGDDEVLIVSKGLRHADRDTAIVVAVNPKYDYVAKVDVASGTYSIFVRDEDGEIPPLNEDYETCIREFNGKCVVPEEAERLTRAMHLDRVLAALERDDDYCLCCTMVENGERHRKRIRYCWLDATHEKLLISRVDITDIVTAQRLRAEEEGLNASYLDNLSIACCVLRVAYDEADRPIDAFYTYSNRAHEHLNGVEPGAMIGRRPRDLFMVGEEDSFSTAVLDTAATGRGHLLECYSPSLQKHLLVSTFQPDPGCCGCVVIDMTERRRLERDLARSRQKLDFILGQTMDVVFQYDLFSGKVDMFTEGSRVDGFPESFRSASDLVALGVIDESQVDSAEAIVDPVRAGEMKSTGEIQMSLPPGAPPRWYRVAFYAHLDDMDGQRCILGYLTDIEDFVRRRTLLEREAKLDPLTGVLNARAGREAASRRISQLKGSRTALLAIFDLDEFKGVNDVHGHQVGDRVLQEFSQVLVTVFRAEDTVYRLGGDEFAVYIETRSDPRRVAQEVMARFYSVLLEHNVDGIPLQASVGIFASGRDLGFDEFYDRADTCLYRSKTSGRGRWTLDVDGES
ncbi:MAG: diguanylate cyclase [Collinsella stercoris]|nr:diguanylate cyclase [Collinsella stercoris]